MGPRRPADKGEIRIMELKIALAGTPNCGKTTLSNNLTGSSQYTGSRSGVPVEKKAAKHSLSVSGKTGRTVTNRILALGLVTVLAVRSLWRGGPKRAAAPAAAVTERKHK